jgi:hypothetical protein
LDIVFKAPLFLLYVIAAVLVVGLTSVLLKRSPVQRKILGSVALLVACGAFLIIFYRDRHLVLDEQGIHANLYGRHEIPWSSIKRAVDIEHLPGSPYAPVRRTSGTAIGNYRTGWFTLAGGGSAFLVMQEADRALLIEDGTTRYLIGVKDMDGLLREVGKHVSIEAEATP